MQSSGAKHHSGAISKSDLEGCFLTPQNPVEVTSAHVNYGLQRCVHTIIQTWVKSAQRLNQEADSPFLILVSKTVAISSLIVMVTAMPFLIV